MIIPTIAVDTEIEISGPSSWVDCAVWSNGIMTVHPQEGRPFDIKVEQETFIECQEAVEGGASIGSEINRIIQARH